MNQTENITKQVATELITKSMPNPTNKYANSPTFLENKLAEIRAELLAINGNNLDKID